MRKEPAALNAALKLIQYLPPGDSHRLGRAAGGSRRSLTRVRRHPANGRNQATDPKHTEPRASRRHPAATGRTPTPTVSCLMTHVAIVSYVTATRPVHVSFDPTGRRGRRGRHEPWMILGRGCRAGKWPPRPDLGSAASERLHALVRCD